MNGNSIMLRTNTTAQQHSVMTPFTGENITSQYSTDVLKRLASLSDKNRWLLFTSNCPRPSQSHFASHNVNCDKVIHMKPSLQYSEEEVVIKAIKAGTASAIVASASLDKYAQTRIQSIATKYHCHVFFLNSSKQLSGLFKWH